MRNEEYYECIYTDRLAKKYISNVVLERPYRKEHYQKVYERLAKIVLENTIIKREYNKIIKKVLPKIIVETVYYSSHCMILNELAKQKGIPTVELQHGMMRSAHAAYQFPDGCGAIEQFPDYVYVFSKYGKKRAHLPIAEDHMKITGYPYFERQLNKYKTRCGKGTIGTMSGRNESMYTSFTACFQ